MKMLITLRIKMPIQNNGQYLNIFGSILPNEPEDVEVQLQYFSDLSTRDVVIKQLSAFMQVIWVDNNL
jgi:hypothetical protein